MVLAFHDTPYREILRGIGLTWLNRIEAMKYFNSGTPLGVLGVQPLHQEGEYTHLPGRRIRSWIRTEDLHETYEEAKKAPIARFFEYPDRSEPSHS